MSNEIVKYSNQFNAQALRKFTALDLDLLMAIAARVRDKEIDEVTFTFEELRQLAHVKKNLTDKELAARIVEVNDRLLACRFRFQDDSRTVQFTLFSGFETDWNDVYRTDPDPEHPLKRGRQLNVMLTGDEYEMLCRAAFKLGIARSAWVRERVYALLCRSYADELSPLTDASIRDNATMLLKELKTKDAGR